MSVADLTNVKNFNYSGEKLFDTAQDFLPINGTDFNSSIQGRQVCQSCS